MMVACGWFGCWPVGPPRLGGLTGTGWLSVISHVLRIILPDFRDKARRDKLSGSEHGKKAGNSYRSERQSRRGKTLSRIKQRFKPEAANLVGKMEDRLPDSPPPAQTETERPAATETLRALFGFTRTGDSSAGTGTVQPSSCFVLPHLSHV